MYNIDFLPQMEASRKYLFGNSEKDSREISDSAHVRYFPPKTVKVIECKEDINGEWVPVPASLEKTVDDLSEDKTK